MSSRQQRRAQTRARVKATLGSPSTSASVTQMLRTAIHHHQSGRLAEAKAFYQSILAVDPRHADALHLLGIIAHQVGQNNIAVDLIGKAIAINGMVTAYYFNQGAALKALGRPNDALASYEAAVRTAPNSPSHRFGLAAAEGTRRQSLVSEDAALPPDEARRLG